MPIYKNDNEKTTVLETCHNLIKNLKEKIRIHLDDRDNYTPGFKFNHWEQRGIPLRLNIGPKDVANNCVEMVLRIDGQKIPKTPLADLENILIGYLEKEQQRLFDRALSYRQENTHTVKSIAELSELIAKSPCFIQAYWQGDSHNEQQIKQDTGATIRVLMDSNVIGKCILTGKETSKIAIFAKAY